MIDLEPIKERLRNTTPGPWKKDRSWWITGPRHMWRDNPAQNNTFSDQLICQINGPSSDRNNAVGDQEFILSAQTDIAALIAEVERLRMALDAERHKVEMRLDLDAIEQRIKRAHEKVSALCHGDERWTMRVPADERYDHDLIIAAALRDADKLLVAVRALLERRDGN